MLKNKSSKKIGNVSNCLRAHHIQTCQTTGMGVSRTGAQGVLTAIKGKPETTASTSRFRT